MSKLKFSDKVITTKEALKDVEPFQWSEDMLSGKTKVIVGSKDTFDEMIKAGEEFKEALGLSDEEVYQTLHQIRENNRTETTLLGTKIESQEYSDELINQCKEEFETFVKPIRNNVVNRYNENTYKIADKEKVMKAVEECSKKYNKTLKNLADE